MDRPPTSVPVMPGIAACVCGIDSSNVAETPDGVWPVLVLGVGVVALPRAKPPTSAITRPPTIRPTRALPGGLAAGRRVALRGGASVSAIDSDQLVAGL